MRSNVILLLAVWVGAISPSYAQRPAEQPDAARILHQMHTLNKLGSVLYIAAHPDDENTRLISYLVNGEHIRTGYLSLTRGSGGQNLIGSEKGEALGIIRTQELIEARRIDGGEQFFTRAVDFGYSKSARESFEKWGKQEVLGDVVRVIRRFRPDVIITRFPSDGGGGHGHHTASAILAKEAFGQAGDPQAFPEQLEQGLTVWQPKRLLWNGSTWWRKDLAEVAEGDPNWLPVDVGGYDPLLGMSYTEIAGRSRSMHKSQGFGARQNKGRLIEYLHHEKGSLATNFLMEGIETSWGRILGGEHIGKMVEQMIRSYDPSAPQRSMDILLTIREQVVDLPVSVWKKKKLNEIDELLRAITGTVVEVTSELAFLPGGNNASLQLLALTRTGAQVRLATTEPHKDPAGGAVGMSVELLNDHPMELELPALNMSIVHEPYWLAKPHGDLYQVEDPMRIGDPVSAAHTKDVAVHYGGLEVIHTVPVVKRWVDRVDGERIRPVVTTPAISIVPEKRIWLVRGAGESITVELHAVDTISGVLTCDPPNGWRITPERTEVSSMASDEQRSITFQIENYQPGDPGDLEFTFVSNGKKYDRTMHVIDHPHILPQVHYRPAKVRMIPLQVKVNANRVGYVEGSGDDVPAAIHQLGVEVGTIDPGAVKNAAELAQYDAIVVGIRAYNKVAAMKTFNPILMEYVERGGTVVAQYNTRSRDMMVPAEAIGPYPFELTRGRVTVEEAPPTFLQRDHPLLNTPNEISEADFDGWVQERGLYFVGERDEHYNPLIAWNDPGEDPLDGALITCQHGNGRYVYTGISFFRQLPAGVAGAYRLFANLISSRDEE